MGDLVIGDGEGAGAAAVEGLAAEFVLEESQPFSRNRRLRWTGRVTGRDAVFG